MSTKPILFSKEDIDKIKNECKKYERHSKPFTYIEDDVKNQNESKNTQEVLTDAQYTR